MSENIAGKVIVITGASSGLGEATARHLAACGAKVVLGGRRSERIEAIAKELTAAGHKAEAIQVDVMKRAQVQNLIDTAVASHGRIDVLLNNAGVMLLSFIEQLMTDEWDQMIDVNIKGMLYGIAAALPHMKAQQSGHVINVASVAGHRTGPTAAIYSATKFAVRALSEGFRQEMKRYNLRTTIISPGAVQSELVDHISDPRVRERAQENSGEIAIGADSFARMVAFAISEPEDVDVNEIIFRPTAQQL